MIELALLALVLTKVERQLPPEKLGPPMGVSARLEDLANFPTAQQTEAALVFSRRYLDHAGHRYLWERRRRDLWQEVLQETEQAREAWLLLAEAHTVGITDQQCLLSLRELLKLLGPDAYYSGQMPEPTPLWAYQDE